VSIQADMLNLFADLQREFHLTYMFISHDLRVVAHVSDRVAVMYFGKIVELGPAGALMATPLHPYTQALLSAEPEPVPARLRNKQRIILKGEIPSALAPPPGCRFHTRCPHATELCMHSVPPLDADSAGHAVACHHWRRIAAPARAAEAGIANERLARLQSAFVH
jgi:oligopeptide/dipeptide ABC transporter ATP-binding protein